MAGHRKAPAEPTHWVFKADYYGANGVTYNKGQKVAAADLPASFIRHHADHAHIMVPAEG